MTAVGDEINPTLRCRGAVDFEISVVSGDNAESYTPVGIYFKQKVAPGERETDANGEANFAPARMHGGKLAVRNHCTLRGTRYEFFVLIRRSSDGTIGMIDPDVENDA